MIHEDKEMVDEPRLQDSALKPVAMFDGEQSCLLRPHDDIVTNNAQPEHWMQCCLRHN